jgi:hypothetical protein
MSMLLRVLLAWIVLTGVAQAHDIWSRAREYNKPNGFPCCGGDPMTGDCEGLTAEDIWDRPDGVEIYSHRYGARIFIPSHRIMVDVPRDVNTKEPLDELTRYEAHYCGKSRFSNGSQIYAVTPDDPDPNYHLFCFFRNASGS